MLTDSIKFSTLILYLLVAILAIVSFPAIECLAAAETLAQVKKVIDGDTLKVELAGRKENLRLIGIDAPEIEINDKALRDSKRSGQDLATINALGRKAKDHLLQLVSPGSKIRIELDVENRDRYGRLLAYVYTDSGIFINQRMLADGYAYSMNIAPNLRHKEQFRAALDRARKDRRGLWNNK